MIIEIVFGLFGLMGLGWIYAGNFAVGVGLFMGWFILILIALLSPTVLTAVSLGLGAFTYVCLCCLPPLGLAVAVASGLRLRDYVRNTQASGNVMYLVAAAVFGFLLICVSAVVLVSVLGGVGVVLSDVPAGG
jgi:hypothetical protein